MKRQKLAAVLTAVVILVCLVNTAALAQELSLSVQGSIRETGASALSNARILLLSSGSRTDPVSEVPVGHDGRFEVSVPGEGLWTLRVTAPGYVPARLDLHALFDDVDVPAVELESVTAVEARRRPARKRVQAYSWYPLPEGTRPADDTDAELFEGRVVGHETGRGVPEAFVWLADDAGTWARTDASGLFRLPRPAGDEIAVSVDAEGYAPTTAVVPGGPSGRPLAVTLRRTVTVHGTVRDPDGNAVPGIRLRVRKESPGSRTSRGTRFPNIRSRLETESGRFSLRKLVPMEPYELVVNAPGFAPLVRSWSPPFGERETDLELIMETGNRLDGEVVTDSDAPVEGAEVVALRAAGPISRRKAEVGARLRSEPFATAVTGPDGRFRLVDLPPGPMDLVVRRQGYAPATRAGLRFQPEVRHLEIEAVRLRPSLDVEGRVVDRHGDGVEGAYVYVAWRVETPGGGGGEFGSGIGLPVALSDRRGGFTLRDMEADRPFILMIRGDGFIPERLEGLVASSDPRSLVVTLSAGARVEGQVLGMDRQPLTGASIEVTPRNGMSSRHLLTLYGDALGATTGSDGGFQLGGLPAGSYDLRARAARHQPRTVRNVILVEDTTADLSFTLEPGVVVEGIVETHDGSPIEAAFVQAGGIRAQTGRGGTFTLDGVPLGRVRVTAAHPSHGRADDDVTVGEGGAWARLVFQPAGRVGGVVVDEASRPVDGATVRLVPRGGSQLLVRSDENGRFSFTDVPAPSDVTLIAEKPELVDAVTQISVEAGGDEDVTLVLAPSCNVRGQIFAARTQDLETLEIYANRSGGPSVAGSLDYQGEYRVEGLRDGPWTLIARTASGQRARASIECRTGDREHVVEMELEEGHLLAVTVSMNGRALSGADVLIRDQDGIIAGGGRTDHQGFFSAAGLAAGDYRISARSSEWALEAGRDVDLPAVGSVDIVLVKYELSGVVSDDQVDQPIDGVRVRLLTTAGNAVTGAKFAETNSEGQFLFPALAAGGYTLAVDHPSYRSQAFSFQLDGQPTRRSVAIPMSATPY